MDLIYTNARRFDQGVLSAYAFDLSFGANENDFSLTLGSSEPVLEFGAFVYIEGTEYGGTVDGIKTSTNGETITFYGRTWHGILNSKVIEPDAGEDYLIVSGDANTVLAMLIERMGLGDLFSTSKEESGITIRNSKIHRYCNGYDGITAMLEDLGAKLKIKWEDRSVLLYAEPIADYTDAPVDGDVATLTVEKYEKKVNHLICLGQGNLANRAILHLYVDRFGRINEVPYFTGLDDISEIYENTNAETKEVLREEGTKRLKELWNKDKAEIFLKEEVSIPYDIGDIVGASEYLYGTKVVEKVSQKIVRINNGVINTEYKTGRSSYASTAIGTSDGGGGGGGSFGYRIIPVTQDEYDAILAAGAIEKDALYMIVIEGG